MSGVKVTNERPARPIPASASVDGDVDGDNVDWTPPDDGSSSSSGGITPYYIPVDETFTVPIYRQALFAEAIEVDGALVVNGLLLGVD